MTQNGKNSNKKQNRTDTITSAQMSIATEAVTSSTAKVATHMVRENNGCAVALQCDTSFVMASKRPHSRRQV
uniref:Uncharacterized protein n=1 Tax=Anguilla anguilla TaxID=7936 RepID=A0A0E9VYI9_ANGAN